MVAILFMQLPKRRSEQQRQHDDQDMLHLTPEGVERLKRELAELERQRPIAVDDVSRSVQMGDLSENAEYKESRHRLSRIQARIFYINDRLKRVRVIEKDTDAEEVNLGCTVVVETQNQIRTYQIVGPSEANPSRGRISNISPLGSTLLHHHVGDIVTIQTPGGESVYKILEIR